MSTESTESESTWRWADVDPFGRTIWCGERQWAEHVEIRPELVTHEAAVRETLRDPDAIYYDERSTAERRLRGNPQAVMLHYVAAGRTSGRQTGNLVCVVVKLLSDPATGAVQGFVSSMYFPDTPQPRVQLVWRGPSPSSPAAPEAP
jgi:hypothetical protein